MESTHHPIEQLSFIVFLYPFSKPYVLFIY
jgi:hypothetical protein